MAALALQPSVIWVISSEQSAPSHPAPELPAPLNHPSCPDTATVHIAATANRKFTPRALRAVTHSVVPSLPSNAGSLQAGVETQLWELLPRLPVPSTNRLSNRLSALGTKCLVVSTLIYLQQQFPGYTSDTKCRPAAKPRDIMAWVQKLQLPDRNSSFIKEQIHSKHTGQHLLAIPAAAGSTNKSLIFLVRKQQAQKVWGKTFHKGILSTESGWAESSNTAGKQGSEGNGAALGLQVPKSSSFHGGLLLRKFSKAQELRQLHTIPYYPKDSWSVAIAHNVKVFYTAKVV